jgi:hypothetical protein
MEAGTHTFAQARAVLRLYLCAADTGGFRALKDGKSLD